MSPRRLPPAFLQEKGRLPVLATVKSEEGLSALVKALEEHNAKEIQQLDTTVVSAKINPDTMVDLEKIAEIEILAPHALH